MEKMVVVPTISCGHCVMTIERELRELEGITGVVGDENARTVKVSWQEPASWESIEMTLRDIGYPPEK